LFIGLKRLVDARASEKIFDRLLVVRSLEEDTR